MQNYYRLLGVGPFATALEIEQAYLRQRARLKRLAAADRAMRARATEVEAGYAILANPRRRAAYNVLLAREPAGPEPAAAAQARLYVDAADWARRVNAALLACCLILDLDWGLPLRRHRGWPETRRPLRQYAHETVRRRFQVLVTEPLSDAQITYRVHTEHTTFRLPRASRSRVPVGTPVVVWQTPLLKVVRRISVPDSLAGSVFLQPFGSGIYSMFAVLTLLLGAVATVGLLPRQSPETVVNTAVVSGLLALVALGVLLFL